LLQTKTGAASTWSAPIRRAASCVSPPDGPRSYSGERASREAAST